MRQLWYLPFQIRRGINLSHRDVSALVEARLYRGRGQVKVELLNYRVVCILLDLVAPTLLGSELVYGDKFSDSFR